MNSNALREFLPIATIAIAISAGTSIVWLGPLEQRASSEVAAATEARRRVSEFDKLSAQVPVLEEQFRTDRSRFKHIDELSRAARNPSVVHEKLNQLASRYKVTIDRIGVQEGSADAEVQDKSPDKGQLAGTTHVSRYEVSLTGTYKAVCEMLDAIEVESSLSRVVNWRMTPYETESEGLVRATMTVRFLGVELSNADTAAGISEGGVP